MISRWIIHVWVGLLQMNRSTFNSIEVLTHSIDGLCQLEFLNFCPISHSALHHHSPIIKKVNNKYFGELWLIETFMANKRVLSIQLEISGSSLAKRIKSKVSGWLDVNDTTWRPLLKMVNDLWFQFRLSKCLSSQIQRGEPLDIHPSFYHP